MTGDKGREFLDILTAEQRTRVTGILDLQRKALQEIIDVRRAIVAELRRTLAALRGLPGYVRAPAYIDSTPVQDVVRVPDTDFFFFPELAPGGCGVMTTPSARRR